MVEKLLNELYNMLNLYVVSSRIEGPQAIYECSLSKTPIISTNVGVATKFLHPSSIFKWIISWRLSQIQNMLTIKFKLKLFQKGSHFYK